MKNKLMNELQRRLEPFLRREPKRISKSANSIRLLGRKLFLVRSAVLAMMAISAYFYMYGITYYKAVLELGFTGAFCETCNNIAEGIPLIVIPKSPAAEKGIQTGDVLLQVNGNEVENWLLPTGIDEPWGLFGRAGSPVSVTIARASQIKTFHLYREKGWNENVTIGLRILDVSESTSIFFALFVELIIIVIFAGSGLFLFLSRSNELMVMLTGVTLTLAGFIFTRSMIYFPNSPAKDIYIAFIIFALPTLFLFFPNGKLVRRSEYILILSYLWWQLYFGFNFSADNQFVFRRYVDIIYWLYVIGSMSIRYRNQFTQEQVQQIKWIYTSLLVIFLVGILFAFTFSIFFSPVPSDIRANLINSLGFTGFRLTSLILPISLVLATRRYNLWQVDVVLNRIEIASILGISVGIAFIVLVAIVKELADRILRVQSALVATTISTIIITYLFQPLQKKLNLL